MLDIYMRRGEEVAHITGAAERVKEIVRQRKVAGWIVISRSLYHALMAL